MLPTPGLQTSNSLTARNSDSRSNERSGVITSSILGRPNCRSPVAGAGAGAGEGGAGVGSGEVVEAGVSTPPEGHRVFARQAMMARHHIARGTATGQTPLSASSSIEANNFRILRYCVAVTASKSKCKSFSVKPSPKSRRRGAGRWTSATFKSKHMASRTVATDGGSLENCRSSRSAVGVSAWTQALIVWRQRSCSASTSSRWSRRKGEGDLAGEAARPLGSEPAPPPPTARRSEAPARPDAPRGGGDEVRGDSVDTGPPMPPEGRTARCFCGGLSLTP
mmetsp:Transcript_46894/g.134060  ORF Transcript_46894/g.134060 Transcript_46894/m.134060 type:complete len:279 (-) Transcript_46894:1592-2428(-)